MKLARRWGDPVVMIADAELLYPETALAIAILETGGFRSRYMMKTHNWFGFRRNRRGYQMRTEKAYGVYADADMMLRDYADFESEVVQRNGLNSEQAFRAWVYRHYAEDPRYRQKLDATIDRLRQ